jgi:hypothetical protein
LESELVLAKAKVKMVVADVVTASLTLDAAAIKWCGDLENIKNYKFMQYDILHEFK